MGGSAGGGGSTKDMMMYPQPYFNGPITGPANTGPMPPNYPSPYMPLPPGYQPRPEVPQGPVPPGGYPEYLSIPEQGQFGQQPQSPQYTSEFYHNMAPGYDYSQGGGNVQATFSDPYSGMGAYTKLLEALKSQYGQGGATPVVPQIQGRINNIQDRISRTV